MFYSEHAYLRNGDHETWGTYSNPERAAKELQLDAHLGSVPNHGTVLDSGAGIGLSLAAAIQVRRPDISVISLDPGFCLPGFWADHLPNLNETVWTYDEDTQEVLVADQTWCKRLVSGSAEELPIKDSTIDLVVSYSAIPEYIYDNRQVLKETLRVLRPGCLALYGPMHEWIFNAWDSTLKTASNANELSEYSWREESIENVHGSEVEAYFTTTRK